MRGIWKRVRTALLIGAALSLVSVAPAHAKRVPVFQNNVGQWSILGYNDHDPMCGAVISNGTNSFIFDYIPKDGYALNLLDDTGHWHPVDGQAYVLNATLSGQPPIAVNGVGWQNRVVMVLGRDAGVLDPFRDGGVLALEAGAQRFQIDLQQSGRALASLDACVKQIFGGNNEPAPAASDAPRSGDATTAPEPVPGSHAILHELPPAAPPAQSQPAAPTGNAPSAALAMKKCAEEWQRKEFDAAMRDCSAALKNGLTGDNRADALFLRGSMHLDRGEFKKAVTDYTDGLALKPDEAMAYESRGEAYNNLHQYDKAIADFGRAIAQQPDLILAYGERGLAELGAGKYDAAIDDFDKAIAQKPDWAEPYFGRGSAHRHKREYDAAIADLSRALQLDPTNPVAYSELGYSHYGLMDYAAALSDADTAIRLDSKLVAAYRVRAHAHLGLGDAAAAVKDLSVGLAIKPDAGLLDERADANRINGALAEADSDLQRAEKLGSDTSLHHMVRGLVRFERGDFAAAHSAFAAAAALAPDDLYPPLWKIIASLRHGDDPGSQILDATTTYDLKQWPGPLIIFAGATPSFDNDDSIEAEAAQGDTATRGDRACEVAFYVGEIYLAAGRAAEAEDRFKQAVDRCPRVYTTANMARFELHQMSAQFSEPASPADASSSAAPLPGEASTLSATDEVHFVGLYILNAAGVYDAETADDPNAADARWIMHGVTGKLTVRKDLSPEQGDAMIEDMIQGLSEACPAGQLHVLRPDFAPPLIGRLRASCSNELYGAYYILLRRPKGGTYIWTTSSDHTLDPARQASDLDNKLAAALTGQAIPEK